MGKIGYTESKTHHVETPDDGDGLLLYNVPRELIDPRDPAIQEQVEAL